MTPREARANRLMHAILANLDNWIERVSEVEGRAIPGNKILLLSLMRDMEQARLSLRRLAGIKEDPPPR